MISLTKISDDHRKCLRPSEILKSEKIMSRLTTCIKNQFISPFDDDLESDKLYKIVSGSYVTKEISNSLLKMNVIGEKCFTDFNLRLVESSKKAFFDTITRNKQATFRSLDIKLKVVNASKQEVKIERDVLGTLLASGCQEEKAVSIDKALEYPLLQVCPSLSTSDGEKRKTTKSNLFTAVSDMKTVETDFVNSQCKIYMLDLAAYVRSVVKQCRTPREIVQKLIISIPVSYKTIYVVCDTYKSCSIKTIERKTRGVGERCILKTPDMKIPYNINNYLSVGDNKEELFNLIKQALREEYIENRKIYFCLRDCYQLKRNEELPRPHLYSDHEEADTKLIAYAKLEEENILVRSPSGNIDIIILFVHHFFGSSLKIFLDNGTGKSRRIYDICSCIIIELCLLPPCYKNFEFHIKRSNYIAYVFKHAHLLIMDIERPSLHGWNGSNVLWSENTYPQDIAELLIEAENV